MISYVIPTRDRVERLHRTLAALAALGPHDAEVVIVDNASSRPVEAPARLTSGLPVRLIRLEQNLGAAGRNAGVMAARAQSDWAVMLDDDSFPLDLAFVPRLASMPADVAAVSADIRLSDGRGREQGGLPEVFIGCGVAVRVPVFVALRGYDASFGYYAEEYDLAARMLLAGYRVVFEPAFRVEHAKVPAGRDMDTIVSRLVRNNGWVIQRYAPESERREALRLMRRRYLAIARAERAERGWAEGAAELRRTRRAQPRRPMPEALWDRFTGLAPAREALRRALEQRPFGSAAVVDRGKHAHLVERALLELGVRLDEGAETRVIGTLSPGPMLDALERRAARGEPVVAPWSPGAVAGARRAA